MSLSVQLYLTLHLVLHFLYWNHDHRTRNSWMFCFHSAIEGSRVTFYALIVLHCFFSQLMPFSGWIFCLHGTHKYTHTHAGVLINLPNLSGFFLLTLSVHLFTLRFIFCQGTMMKWFSQDPQFIVSYLWNCYLPLVNNDLASVLALS